MKKKLITLAMLFFLCIQPVWVSADELMDIVHEAGYTEALDINRPKASIVIDAKTGDVLWGDNVDAPRDPASMSKLMALYLVFEAMAEGKFSPDTMVTATANDEAMSKLWEISNNKIVAGVDYKVSELIIATIVPSSNTATLMLANLVEPDPDLFIDKMNAKAKELGMVNTQFFNGTGAVARAFQGYYAPTRYDIHRTNITTARDFAILTYHFVNNFPSLLNYTGDSNITIKAGTPYEETFKSYNYSLPNGKYALEGVTGLKTGSSPSAAFNITATAKRGEQELIAVIMGVGDWSDQDGEYYRHPFTNALLEKAFTDYDYTLLADAGIQTVSGKEVNIESPIYGTVPTGKKDVLSYADGKITLNNGLSPVSSLITEKHSFAAKEKEDKSQVKVSGGSSLAVKPKPVNVWMIILPITLILFLLLIGFFILEAKIRKNRRVTRQSRRG